MYKESTTPLNEQSLLLPRNPYAIAKYKVKNSIDTNELNTKNLIFLDLIIFNHDSELMTDNFLILKIINKKINIYKKNIKKITVGSLDYIRDWSYAGDIMDAAIKMLELDSHQTFVIGSGKGTSIQKLLEITFSEFNFDWNKFVDVDKSLLRKNDPIKIVSDPSKIESKLCWATKHSIEEIIQKFIKYKMDLRFS